MSRNYNGNYAMSRNYYGTMRCQEVTMGPQQACYMRRFNSGLVNYFGDIAMSRNYYENYAMSRSYYGTSRSLLCGTIQF